MNRPKLAYSLFGKGYGCAQSVLLAFDDLTPISKTAAQNIAAPFNGGMGEAMSICGAFSGALMVIGLVEGEKHENQKEKSQIIRHKSDLFIKTLKQEEGVIGCKEILYRAELQKRDTNRTCNSLVEKAVIILEQIIET